MDKYRGEELARMNGEYEQVEIEIQEELRKQEELKQQINQLQGQPSH